MIAAFCAFVVLGQQAATPANLKVPEWATDAIALMKKEGILEGYSDYLHRRPPTRYELAVATYATHAYVANVIKSTQSAIASSKLLPFRFDEGLREDLNAISTWKPRVRDLVRLAVEFDFELIAIGVPKGFAGEVRQLEPAISKLVSSVETFSDVPKGHWAADAIHTLRRAGILVGYPGGSYNPPKN